MLGNSWQGAARAAAGAIGVACALGAATPASAQFFYKTTPFETGAVTGSEPGLGLPLPGATPAEYRAALVWNMRAALNVAALQCQFAPQLGTLANYNAILQHHRGELKNSYDVLAGYFKRTNKTAKAGQDALDIYGTKTYSAFSTVGAQLGFCQAAGDVSSAALFTRQGKFYELAQNRMRQLRSSLISRRELKFHYYVVEYYRPNLPNLNSACWDKTNSYDFKRCPWVGYTRVAR
ncbi:hypothetical protein [Sphingomonas sanxanigenens]|uniref:hypothetical protein n=1 Tax=Sphingomonas sanxanigenens TaxID=397260 RepID=UPI001FE1A258|nr:hypothetical protein [Sphingomonas sanxanigenens]